MKIKGKLDNPTMITLSAQRPWTTRAGVAAVPAHLALAEQQLVADEEIQAERGLRQANRKLRIWLQDCQTVQQPQEKHIDALRLSSKMPTRCILPNRKKGKCLWFPSSNEYRFPSVTSNFDTKIRWCFGVKIGLPTRPGTELGLAP